MIPRYQKVLFVVLLAVSLAMGGILWHLRNRAHKQMLAGQTSAPTQAPEVALTEGKPLEDCAKLGAIAAAEVISHMGPRPAVKLADLAA